MNELSLFTGAGGGVLGTKLLGWRTIGYVEKEKFCQEIIKARIADGCLDSAPIFGDIQRFIGEGWARKYRGKVDIISAGFPCQSFSNAGKKLGEDDPRNMWPSTIETIRQVRPRYAFLENVPGLLVFDYTRGIFRDLAESGYDLRWDCVGASDVGAPHRRKRLWILAYANSSGRGERQGTEPIQEEQSSAQCGSKDLADTTESGLSKSGFAGKRKSETEGRKGMDNRSTESGWWSTEPAVGRVAHGVARRVDRLKAIGNGQVPAVVKAVWESLNGET